MNIFEFNEKELISYFPTGRTMLEVLFEMQEKNIDMEIRKYYIVMVL